MLQVSKLWNLTYLFGPNPLDFSRSDKIFFVAGIAFVILAIAGKVWAIKHEPQSPSRHLFNRLYHLFLTIGILVVFWGGARFENIPWLSTHFLVLLFYLGWLVWLGFIGFYFFGDFRLQHRIWQDEVVKRKYLAKQ